MNAAATPETISKDATGHGIAWTNFLLIGLGLRSVVRAFSPSPKLLGLYRSNCYWGFLTPSS
jgi:hypothetical protein